MKTVFFKDNLSILNGQQHSRNTKNLKLIKINFKTYFKHKPIFRYLKGY